MRRYLLGTPIAALVTLTLLEGGMTAQGLPQSAAKPALSAAKPAGPAARPITLPSALSNQDVIDMVKAGASEELVLKYMMGRRDRAFDLSPKGIVALKTAGVSDQIVSAMLGEAVAVAPVAAHVATPAPAPAETKTTNTPPSAPRALPKEIGVYVASKDAYMEVDPELVSWKTGGVFLSALTSGITKSHVNGSIKGTSSTLLMPRKLDVVIYTPEGTSATEYQLLRLTVKKSWREFRAMSMSMLGAKSGADENAVNFQNEKLQSRTYRITAADLAPGEYGLLPPYSLSASGASMTTSGKIHTFTVK
jgi:hypothetical protein